MDETLLAALARRYALADCQEWRSLVRLLDYASGFSFIPLIVPDAAGAEVCRRALITHLAIEGKSLLSLPLTPVDKDALSLEPLLHLAILEHTGVLWVTPDPDLWANDANYDPSRAPRFEETLWPRFCSHANQARDLIRHRISIPLILVGTDLLRGTLRLHAPDLWSIRDAVIKPEPRQETLGFSKITAFGEIPLEIPILPPVTGNLDETLLEIERLENARPDSPSLPVLLKRTARLEMDLFQWQDAEQHLTAALGWEERHHAHFSERILTHSLLQDLFSRTAIYLRAMFHGERALEIAQTEYPSDSTEVAIHLNNLALLLKVQGKLAEAEPLYRRALAIREEKLGKDHLDVSTSLNNLAVLLKDQGKLTAAEPLYSRAIAIGEETLGKDHPKNAVWLNNLARFFQDHGRLVEAEPLYRRAIAIGEEALGKDHPDFAIYLNNLGLLLKDQGKLAEAEPLFRRALAIGEATLGMDHPQVAHSLNNLALLLEDQGKPTEAEPLYRRAFAIGEEKLGKNHPTVAIWLNNLALLLEDQDRLAEAELLFRRHLEIIFHHRRLNGTPFQHEQTAIRNYSLLLEQMHRTPDEIAAEIRSVEREAELGE